MTKAPFTLAPKKKKNPTLHEAFEDNANRKRSVFHWNCHFSHRWLELDVQELLPTPDGGRPPTVTHVVPTRAAEMDAHRAPEARTSPRVPVEPRTPCALSRLFIRLFIIKNEGTQCSLAVLNRNLN